MLAIVLVAGMGKRTGFDGKQYMRIAVRNHEDNNKFIEAFKSLE